MISLLSYKYGVFLDKYKSVVNNIQLIDLPSTISKGEAATPSAALYCFRFSYRD